MTKFIIKEDFPKNQAEFDKRFCNEQFCHQYLFQCRWPGGFTCSKCENDSFWDWVVTALHGVGSRSFVAVRSVKIEKSFRERLRLMNFI